jgi:hypothetical protein
MDRNVIPVNSGLLFGACLSRCCRLRHPTIGAVSTYLVDRLNKTDSLCNFASPWRLYTCFQPWFCWNFVIYISCEASVASDAMTHSHLLIYAKKGVPQARSATRDRIPVSGDRIPRTHTNISTLFYRRQKLYSPSFFKQRFEKQKIGKVINNVGTKLNSSRTRHCGCLHKTKTSHSTVSAVHYQTSNGKNGIGNSKFNSLIYT